MDTNQTPSDKGSSTAGEVPFSDGATGKATDIATNANAGNAAETPPPLAAPASQRAFPLPPPIAPTTSNKIAVFFCNVASGVFIVLLGGTILGVIAYFISAKNPEIDEVGIVLLAALVVFSIVALILLSIAKKKNTVTVPFTKEERDLAIRLHGGSCPCCGGSGPVDVHYSFQVLSFFLVTRYKTVPKISCVKCGRKAQGVNFLLTFLAGWWGFPFGLVFTPIFLVRNLLALFFPPSPLHPSAEMTAVARALLWAYPQSPLNPSEETYQIAAQLAKKE